MFNQLLVMKRGDRVRWKTANGWEEGAVECELWHGWLVRLENGKYAIVPKKEDDAESDG